MMAAGAFVAGFSAMAGIGSAVAAEDVVTLRLDWLPSGYHAPLFLGVAKNYYKDAGINLTIADGKGTNVALQAVAAGNDMIGLANYTTMLMAADKDLPVVGIGGLLQKQPDAIIALKGTGIKTPQDLIGKSIATAGTTNTARLFFTYLGREKGIDISKIRVVQTDASATRTTLLQNKVDAIAAWALSDALLVAGEKPIDPPMLYADHGFNVLGIGFVVSKTTAASKGDVLTRFMSATAKAYAEAIKDPQAAAEALAAVRTGVDKDRIIAQIKLLPDFMQTANSAGKPFGWTSRADWEQTKTLLTAYYDLKKPVDLDTAYTNGFVNSP
jgi:NitT/TauT family transport system substrate-binding protein